MRFSMATLKYKGKSSTIKKLSMKIEADHPLLQIADTLPWKKLGKIVEEDLRAKDSDDINIDVRMMLSIYLLQIMFDHSDLAMEKNLKSNPYYQIFTGKQFIPNWKIPSPTEIEWFRNCLSLKTMQQLFNFIANHLQSINCSQKNKSE